MTPRIPKQVAIDFAVRMAPQYSELLRDLQRGGGRFQLQKELEIYRNLIGAYVRLYEDEKRLNMTFALGLVGEDGIKDFAEKLNGLTQPEAEASADEFFRGNSLFGDSDPFDFPKTEAEKTKAKAEFEALSTDEQKQFARQCAHFFGGAFASFFNILSLMVHGAKLTSLVPRALAGDDDAFLKAIQIDRLLLTHSSYFRERKQRAQDDGEIEFLSRLAYREINPPLQGKIRYPGLYMMFGCLEATQWLDELLHKEILDFCDDAKLDRYQNRIEDVTFITKRLIEYRRWQKSGGLSMH